jgi:hypothetical protein
MIETRPEGIRRRLGGLAVLLVLASAPGCAPASIIGPLSRQQEERHHLLTRARTAGMSVNLLDRVAPPLTPAEEQVARRQNASCRSSYMWKDGLTWTGSALVGVAAGVTIGGAYATGNNDTTGKIIFGISAGTMAALGSILVAAGGIIQQRFTDRGCVSTATEN